MFVWTGRQARENVDVWDVQPKSTLHYPEAGSGLLFW